MCHVAKLIAHGTYVGASEYRHSSPGRLNQSGQRSQQGRLPCPIVPQNCVQPPAIESGAHTAQCGKSSELFCEIFYSDEWRTLMGGFGILHKRPRNLTALPSPRPDPPPGSYIPLASPPEC